MKDLIFYGALGTVFLQGFALLMNAKRKDICNCIVNATIMICLTITLTR